MSTRRLCEGPGCGVSLDGHREGKRYCGTACKTAAWRTRSAAVAVGDVPADALDVWQAATPDEEALVARVLARHFTAAGAR